ncbi:MAG TPA: hypothetical protein DDW52_16555, partial [Planctomycetaceae bacterium]|nr:hypothetical protein [Planctomycetaceae bacterium]
LARAGRPEKALEACMQAQLDRNVPGQIFAIAAISHIQLGNTQAARQQLKLADAFAERLLEQQSELESSDRQRSDESRGWKIRWFDHAEFELLYRQARELLNESGQ